MTKERSGGATLAVLALALFVIVCATAIAANNSAPSGHNMSNRKNAKWAMGQPYVFKACASANNTLPATGVAVGDVVAGMINLSDASEAQESLANITVAANSITSSGTPWTANEHYAVIVWRAQADPR